MKTAFSFLPILVCCMSFNMLNAQSQTNLHLDVEYSLPPATDTAMLHKTFFIARFGSDFLWKDYNQMATITAKRIFAQLNSGRKVYNYESIEIGSSFWGDMEIGSAAKLNPLTFALPAGNLIPVNLPHSEFSLQKNGNAASWRVTVLPDFRFQTATDTTLVLSKNGKKLIPVSVPEFLDPQSSALLFVESWNFNPKNGQFRKNIHQVGYIEMLRRSGENIGYSWTACIDNSDTVGIQKQDVLFKENVVTDVAMNYTETRIIFDSLAKDYSGLDALQDLNRTSGNIPEAQRVQFLAALMSYAFTYPENVYPVTADMKVDSLHAFGKTENLEKLFTSWDSTHFTEDPNNPGTIIMAPLLTTTTFENVYGLRFYEDWYYDPKDFVIKKRVKGIGLLMIKPDMVGGATIQDKGIYIKFL